MVTIPCSSLILQLLVVKSLPFSYLYNTVSTYLFLSAHTAFRHTIVPPLTKILPCSILPPKYDLISLVHFAFRLLECALATIVLLSFIQLLLNFLQFGYCPPLKLPFPKSLTDSTFLFSSTFTEVYLLINSGH